MFLYLFFLLFSFACPIKHWSNGFNSWRFCRERIFCRATKMIQGMEHLPYSDRLKRVGAVQLGEEKALRWHLIAAFQYLKESYRKEGDRLFSGVCGDRTSGKVFKLKEGRFRLPIRKKSFTVRLVAQRCGLMPCPWRLSRQGWIRPWATCSSCACLCSLRESWTRWSLKVPSNSEDSTILNKWNPVYLFFAILLLLYLLQHLF